MPSLAARETTKPKAARRKAEILISLIVRGDLDKEAIASTLGIEASKSWSCGDVVHSKATLRHEDAGWQLKVAPSSRLTFQQHVNKLIRKIAPHAEAFQRLPPGAVVYLHCAIYDFEYRSVAITFPKEALRVLADIGAAIDIDYYDLSDESDDV